MDQVVIESFWERRFFGTLFTVFAGLALFLAAIGLYGVMAYSVRQRTQEIGVRMALGAQAADVLRLVTVHGIRLIVLGLAIGVVFAIFSNETFAGQSGRRFRARSVELCRRLGGFTDRRVAGLLSACARCHAARSGGGIAL